MDSRRPLTSPLTAMARLAESAPAQVAFLRGDESVTMSAWRRRVDDYRDALLEAGVGPGARVLLWTETGPEMAAALFAAWGAGAIAVIMDSRAGEVHFEHAVGTATPSVVIASEGGVVPSLPAPARVIRTNEVGGSQRRLPPLHVPLPTEPASIVFTSGSTGRPKGVTQSHGNLLRGCLAVNGYLGTSAADRILCTVPWSFDYGYGQLLTAAVVGSTIVLPAIANPIGMCDAIERHSPTVLAGIPSVFTYLLRGVSPIRSMTLSSIRSVTNTGGAIPGPVLDDLFALFPDAAFFLNYGLTETYRTSYLDPALAREKPTSVGRGIPGVDVAVVREDGSVAAPGEEGEIVHRGDFICMGYWNDPEATARAHRPDPLAVPGSPGPPRALFTGDYGHQDDEGFLYVHGRRDHQLKSMGVRVSPAEIEEQLYRSGFVREVAVVGARHEMLGDEICAFAVANDGVDRLADALARYSRRVMSPFMIPRRITVCETLPKTPTGKIDYPRLTREANAQSQERR